MITPVAVSGEVVVVTKMIIMFGKFIRIEILPVTSCTCLLTS